MQASEVAPGKSARDATPAVGAVSVLDTALPVFLDATGQRAHLVRRASIILGPVLLLSGATVVAAVGWPDLLAVVRDVAWAALVVIVALGTLRAVAMCLMVLVRPRTRSVVTGAGCSEPITVIIPAYNEEARIAAAIRGAAASLHPVAIIVIDDGSTDRTRAIVEEFSDVLLIRQAKA
jgi:Glycosyl transferase family 2